MATTYITNATRYRIIDSMIDAMLEVGDIDDSQVSETQAWLLSLSNTQLHQECNDRCPEEWNRLS